MLINNDPSKVMSCIGQINLCWRDNKLIAAGIESALVICCFRQISISKSLLHARTCVTTIYKVFLN